MTMSVGVCARTPDHGQKFAPTVFYEWLKKQQQLAERVVVCYEAEPARRMQALGVEVCVIAAQNGDEQGKRQSRTKWTRR